jgi:predicted DNA-binding mobile mystery protein A
MKKSFQKLMREQVQESLNSYLDLINKAVPQKGWIRTIRDALGMSAAILAKRLDCQPSNVTTIEQREKKGTITLETLEKVAQAMGCKLIYSIVPLEPLNKILEKKAREVAHKRIQTINHSMKLEEQGLNEKQLKQQEDDLVQELLQEHSKKLWNDDYEV